jgi:hypothetical protein
MNMPAINDPTIAHLIVMLCVVTITAITVVIASAPSWLTISSVRRFMWSLITPMGKEISKTGIPMTKRINPLMSDFAPNSSANQTNEKRWVLCTSMNKKLFIHNRRNGRIARSSPGRIP